ncbi:MAG TPA: ABC transporter ATP-binding protein [Phycisphaerae bacterium]|nr:ABC transporter ATP-binding protein [Phycisphaerae bacterium]
MDDVDLVVPAGEIFGMIGPNGAGKTTTLRMLGTALEPTAGQVFFDGRDIWDDPVDVRSQIGFMPDFFQLYRQLKVWELLGYFGIAHGMKGASLDRRVDEVLRLIGLTEKREALCKGLSRGMVQRLGLGRAILHRPKLLLLDEPASGLDPLARKILFDTLRSAHAEGATIIISSHILGELSDLCTSVGIMNRGRFIESGPTGDVVRRLLPKRKIELRVLDGSQEAAGAALSGMDDVHDLRRDKAVLHFDFDGTDEDLANLNAELIERGVRVVLLQESATSLHEAYFAITERAEDAKP